MVKVTASVTIKYSACDYLFDFNIIYASILYRFRVTASCQKSLIIIPPPTIVAGGIIFYC